MSTCETVMSRNQAASRPATNTADFMLQLHTNRSVFMVYAANDVISILSRTAGYEGSFSGWATDYRLEYPQEHAYVPTDDLSWGPIYTDTYIFTCIYIYIYMYVYT